jgi:hypothetical protein
MPSATASNLRGFRTVTRILRSLLYHELGVPLACYLDDGPKAFRLAQRHSPELFQSVPPPNATVTAELHEPTPPPYEDFLKESVEEWVDAARAVGGVPMERGLTSLLSSKMREALEKDGMTVAHDEKLHAAAASGGGFGFGGYPDILVRKHEILEGQTYPVLLVEVGLRNGEWWKKVDQALMYAAGLFRRPPNDAAATNNNNVVLPILVTALTLEIGEPRKPNKGSKPHKNKQRRKTTTTTTTTFTSKCTTIGSKKPPSGAFQRGRIGTFLVTAAPAHASKRSTCVDDLRVMLLRRVETADVSVLSAEMGKVIRAAQLLPAWAAWSRPHATTPGGQQQEQSFGPHSRRVGTNVRYTPLSPGDCCPLSHLAQFSFARCSESTTIG